MSIQVVSFRAIRDSHLTLFDTRKPAGPICTVVRAPKRIAYVNGESIHNNGRIFRDHKVSQNLLPWWILREGECFDSVSRFFQALSGLVVTETYLEQGEGEAIPTSSNEEECPFE